MILCSGENLIDNVPIKGSKDSYKACVGGSPLNTALSLGKLKIPTYKNLMKIFSEKKKNECLWLSSIRCV